MKLFLTYLFVAASTIVFAQSNYHKGYIVKPNGDTVKGYVDYREWTVSPLEIDFKTNLSDKQPQHLAPNSIRGFGIDSMENYLSYNGLISMDRNRFPDLADKLDTTKAPESIFMKLLISGKYLSLYMQDDYQKTRFFIVEAGTAPVELKYNYYHNETGDAIERALFRGQLIIYVNKYAPGNSALIEQANGSQFKEYDLKTITYKINGDTTAPAKMQLSTNNKPRWFIGVGFSLITNRANLFNMPLPYTNKGYEVPRITFGLDHFDNPNVQQWVYRLSLSFSFVNGKVGLSQNESQSVDVESVTQFTTTLAGQILYNLYNKDNFKYYIGAGAAGNLSSMDIQNNTSRAKFSPFWGNILFETGFIINRRCDLSFTYAPYSKMTPDSYNKAYYRSLGLGVKLFVDK
jgi:hypothetical protein